MAIDSMLKRYTDERDQKMQLIENISSVADEAGRDLLDSELTTISEAQARVRSLNSHIDTLSSDLELADTVKDRLRTLDPNIVARDFTYRSAGEYVYDMLHQNEDRDAHTRISKFNKRAAEHMGLDKANTVPVAGGFNGLVVAPVLGAVLDPSPVGRPLFTSLGGRQITTLSFVRPRIVDPNFATGVGVVAKEKEEMPSKAWDILAETVTTTRYGGYINVSGVLEEMMAGSLDMVVSHMNRRVENLTEVAVVTEFNRTTANVPLAAGADSAAIIAALGQASTLVVQNTQQMPTSIAMGPIGWGILVGSTDLAGRPILPPLNPSNALGNGGFDTYFPTIGGLRAVVSPAITDDSLYVYNSAGLEIYERRMPMMQALEPSLYGRQVAVATFLGFYHPITTENVTTPVRAGIVKITIA